MTGEGTGSAEALLDRQAQMIEQARIASERIDRWAELPLRQDADRQERVLADGEVARIRALGAADEPAQVAVGALRATADNLAGDTATEKDHR